MAFRTLQFLYALLRKRYPNVVREPQQLHFDNGKTLAIDVYRHPKRRYFRGTILFIPGMTKMGNTDVRVIALCSALAQSGYLAIAPNYVQITELLIDNALIDDMEHSMLAMLADKRLCPKNKLAIFSASYAGAMAIRAATREPLNQHISAFCTIGSPYTSERAFRYVLSENGATDRYAKFILLRNILRLEDHYDPVIDQALYLAADDAYEKNGQTSLSEFMAKQSAEKQQAIHKLTTDFSEAYSYVAKNPPSLQAFNTAFNQAAQFGKLRCRVALIHSVHDTIFSAEETTLLYKELRRRHVPCRMLVTPLLDHVNYSLSLRQSKQLVQLANIFKYFFRYA